MIRENTRQIRQQYFDDQLDQALAPPGLPDGLEERILARTVRELRGQRSILARIGASRWRLAASIAITLGLGAMVYTSSPMHSIYAVSASVAQISEQLNQLASTDQTPDSGVDQQIDQVRTRLAMVESNDVWGSGQYANDDITKMPLVASSPTPSSAPVRVTAPVKY